MLLKSATLDRHIEGLNQIADQLLQSWSRYEGRVVEHLENDLYTYFVQVTFTNDFTTSWNFIFILNAGTRVRCFWSGSGPEFQHLERSDSRNGVQLAGLVPEHGAFNAVPTVTGR
jgi:hypothetical protein